MPNQIKKLRCAYYNFSKCNGKLYGMCYDNKPSVTYSKKYNSRNGIATLPKA